MLRYPRQPSIIMSVPRTSSGLDPGSPRQSARQWRQATRRCPRAIAARTAMKWVEKIYERHVALHRW